MAIVTGASSGIGPVIAVELGRLGWRIALGAAGAVDRLDDAAKAVREAGGDAFVHALDVTSVDSIEAFVTAAESLLGPVEVLVNNAGMATPGWLHEIPTDAIEREVVTNLLGPLLMSRLAIASLRRERAPRPSGVHHLGRHSARSAPHGRVHGNQGRR